MDAASGGGFSFWKSRSSAIALPDGSAEEDLSLNKEDTEHCTCQDRNKALEAEAAIVRAVEEASPKHGRGPPGRPSKPPKKCRTKLRNTEK